MSDRSQQPHQNAQGVPGPSRVVPSTYADSNEAAVTFEEPKSMQRIHANMVAALEDAPHELLDPALHQPADTSQAAGSSLTGRGPAQATIFEGLLPRIETRGQSKRPARNASGRIQEIEQTRPQHTPPERRQDYGEEESGKSTK